MSDTPLLYRLVTASIALTGSISLFLTGELNPVFSLPGLAMIPGYYRHIKGRRQAPGWAVGGLSALTLLIMIFDSVVISGDFFIAVAHMTVFFQAIKSFDLKEPWDPLQVYFMALLQLVMISELSLSLWVGVAFLAFLLMLLSAIVLAHFLKEGSLRMVSVRRPILFVSAAALILTFVFFITIPRFKGGMFGRKTSTAIKTVGFSEEVNFGSFGRVLENPTIVMRIELSGRKQPLYWRGLSLDRFDGSSWRDSIKQRRRIPRHLDRYIINDAGKKGEYTEQRIILEPMDTEVIFGLGGISAVKARGSRVAVDSAGSVFLLGKNKRRISYTAFSIPYLWMNKGNISPYLQLPEGISPKIASLSREVTVAVDDDTDKVRRIEKYLMDNYEYSLKVDRPPAGVIPIEDFLFYSRKGFCEHYATAMVLMLRSLGIPSRIVTGYAGGEVNSYGDYVILRQKNAHSWVEAFVNGMWMRFDPTPKLLPSDTPLASLFLDSLRMKWLRYVVGFSSLDQIRILRSFTMPVLSAPDMGIYRVDFTLRPLYVLFVVAALVPVVLFGRRISFKRYSAETRAYLKFRKMIRRKGGSVGASSTPAEVKREALRLHMDKDTVREFIDKYEAVRFGGLPRSSRIFR
jgi:transglutaminase-like putative cysteine protease